MCFTMHELLVERGKVLHGATGSHVDSGYFLIALSAIDHESLVVYYVYVA